MPRMSAEAPLEPSQERLGFILVFLASLTWSFGGTFERFVQVDDSWTIVFWRSTWAAIFLICFMLWRDGPRNMVALFANMGWPGIAVAVCFAFCSSSFVIALSYTNVANVLLIQAGVPLFAALIAWAVMGERISAGTWIAIAAVICGVAIMVSGSFSGDVSPIGDGLALAIALVFSIATVITRRYAHVRMVPATALGTVIAAVFAATQASALGVSGSDVYVLFGFGALNLGMGLAFFSTGARLIPAAFAALICTLETILGPLWVWLIHAELPSGRAMIGGAVVLLALLGHISVEFKRLSRPARPGVTGMPAPR
ncbi:MAG: DMT family transporter [Rhizobiaceae bacterium]|nr:DMT family transporter [Rhizobiaceae bacterium]